MKQYLYRALCFNILNDLQFLRSDYPIRSQGKLLLPLIGYSVQSKAISNSWQWSVRLSIKPYLKN